MKESSALLQALMKLNLLVEFIFYEAAPHK
jgi:hypothetical protein